MNIVQCSCANQVLGIGYGMEKPNLPTNERERLENLLDMGILDTDTEDVYDNLVALAASVTGCPISLISLVDSDRQWFKAKVGLEAIQTPRDISFCGHAITSGDELFEIQNTTLDERFHDNPLVTNGPQITFYAGQPLKTADGHRIGTLCVLDKVPRTLDENQKNQMKIIAKLVTSLLESSKRVSRDNEDSRNKTAFVSSMSHEIRTPITAIKGYIDVIDKEMNECTNKTVKNAVKIIKDSSEHLNSLVGDILDFSKLDAKKVISQSKPLDLRRLLAQVHNIMKLEAANKSLEFELSTGVELPPMVRSDSTLIKQMLLNLISNAIKFTKKGKVTLKANYDAESGFVTFAVIDTGIGMNSNEVTKIFSPYMQANSTIRLKYKGTGLGMPITKEIAQLMGGKLSVIKTAPGEGTHFEIKIPVKIHTADITPKPEKVKKTFSRGVSKSLNDISNILVVDDVPENIFLIRHFLKDYNFNIDGVKDAQEALTKKINRYDIVFLDMNLPGMGGKELFQELSKTNPKTRFIAFTASSNAQERRDCYDIGFSNFLSKPFDTKSIVRSLESDQSINLH